ncbi:MAG: hypothetical protein JKY56_16095 [Kofleriaceae bacterium]|nr:hypothetical protein [Kofleriaceae bacterium]
MTLRESMMDARASARVKYEVRAVLAPTPVQQGDDYFGEGIFEVSTRDLSESGALSLVRGRSKSDNRHYFVSALATAWY